jgi:hypothetical protein
MKTIEERIKYLEYCANLYETSGSSPLQDDDYDSQESYTEAEP